MSETQASPVAAQAAAPTPVAVTIAAADGFPLRAFVWRHRPCMDALPPRPVVIVNAATSVRCRYYFRFAQWLHENGCDVVVYDYRGIGESRPPDLAQLSASWLDWGERDFEAVLRHVRRTCVGQPIDVVAHSIGGFVIGLAPSNACIRRVFTVGAQYAHWRDYAPRHRLAMLWKWHAVMPLLSALCGYFPARRLGWMEDTPRGVALSWSRSAARFEDSYQRAPIARTQQERDALVRRFAGLRAQLLAFSASDDAFGTVPAIERLLRYFVHSDVTHWRVTPQEIGVDSIGHFAFFHSRFEKRLWPLALHWLRFGALDTDRPGRIASIRSAGATSPHRAACAPCAQCAEPNP
ncbi:alpha/beta hydrolase family protein [Paraburkholderia acidisoli]|uniref:Alpha/beta fold hydrolase n=1 Tax=Paraburkholderia acidisoli TaxID=2571748 RepID=A0A7Z2GQG5_9BURK|nr:alpha/beta fold hydrolase [Paraburkholderia acidisoli]QGZ66103.1 alpha/beta fold hydrolase [Paraburkholderia acidisoli]